MAYFGEFVTFEVASEDAETLMDNFSEAREQAFATDKCHLFVINRDAEDDTKVYVFEVWSSRQDYDEFTQNGNEVVQGLIQEAMELFSAEPKIIILDVEEESLPPLTVSGV